MTTTQALPAIAPALFWTLVLFAGICVLTMIVLAVQTKLTFRQAARRALRTFLQAVVGTLTATFAGAAFATGEALTDQLLLKLLISALLAGIVSLVSLFQNLLEDNTDAVPTMAKIPGT